MHFARGALGRTRAVGPVTPAPRVWAPWRFGWLALAVEMAAATVFGLVAAWAVSLAWWQTLVCLGLVLITHYHDGVRAIRPGLPQIARVVRATAIPIAIASVAKALHPALAGDTGSAAFTLVVVAASSATLLGAFARSRLHGPTRTLVVGDRHAIREAIARADGQRTRLVGALLIDDDPYAESLAGDDLRDLGVQTITSIADVGTYAEESGADLVVVHLGSSIGAEEFQCLQWAMERSTVALAVAGPLSDVAPHRLEPAVRGGMTVVHVASPHAPLPARVLKSAIDRSLGAVLLVLTAPLLAILSWLIRRDSPGPGIFTQVRVGQRGREFTMYKLRTMCNDAESIKADLIASDEGNGVLFKMKNDPRVTQIGSVLRKTSLDELPQLINVVKGDMSLIGPRPALPSEVAQYNPRASRRLAVRPGMTGLWQVSGRSNLSWDRTVELDVRYADNLRLIDDLAIGLKTFSAVRNSRGAY